MSTEVAKQVNAATVINEYLPMVIPAIQSLFNKAANDAKDTLINEMQNIVVDGKIDYNRTLDAKKSLTKFNDAGKAIMERRLNVTRKFDAAAALLMEAEKSILKAPEVALYEDMIKQSVFAQQKKEREEAERVEKEASAKRVQQLEVANLFSKNFADAQKMKGDCLLNKLSLHDFKKECNKFWAEKRNHLNSISFIDIGQAGAHLTQLQKEIESYFLEYDMLLAANEYELNKKLEAEKTSLEAKQEAQQLQIEISTAIEAQAIEPTIQGAKLKSKLKVIIETDLDAINVLACFCLNYLNIKPYMGATLLKDSTNIKQMAGYIAKYVTDTGVCFEKIKIAEDITV